MAWLGLSAAGLVAQEFNSGSTGSYGALTVANNATLTVELPPDGILHCTTVTVGISATLRFTPNALNTPVYLLAQSNVVFESGSSIGLTGGNSSGALPGRGGPGGFGGGYGGFGPTAPANRGGDGFGPGRGVNAQNKVHAVYSRTLGANTSIYGNALILPLIGGSGGTGGNGNPGQGGGGGGGAILIASSTSIVMNGQINVTGGSGGAGYGSGGAVRLVAPTGGGNGNIQTANLDGNQGRIRIDTTEPTAFRNLNLNGMATRGKQMYVFPPTASSLHFVEVAGQTIAVGEPATVTVTLPVGAPLTQTVVLRAQGFTGEVPVRLVVTPEHTASTVVDLVLNASANPPELTTQISLPVGEPTRVEAWTR